MSTSMNPAGSVRLPVVEGVGIGRTVSLDPRVWRRHEGDTFLGLERADLAISAQGYLKLDEMTHIHRFYTDDELMLQVGTSSAAGGKGDDLTVFQPLSSETPSGDWERRTFLDQLRKSQFHYQGCSWDRFWYPGHEGDEEPVTLWEAVYEDLSGAPTRLVAQTCMLYSRPLEAGGHELLLAMEATPEGGAPSQEIMVGLPVSTAEFFA